jgi:hypothetical protein
LAAGGAAGAGIIGRGGAIRFVLEDAGQRLQLKYVPAGEGDRRQQTAETLDPILRGLGPKYPELLACGYVDLNGERCFLAVRPFKTGSCYGFGSGQFEAALALLNALAELEPLGAAHGGDFASVWLSEPTEGFASTLDKLADLGAHRLDGLLRVYGPPLLARLPGLRSMQAILVHGDLHGGNVLFRGSAVEALVDWDEATLSHFPVDAAKAAWFFCRRGRGAFRLDEQRSRRFVAACRQARFSCGLGPADLFSLGAVYFVPRVDHIALLERRSRSLLCWYLGWIEAFWTAYGDNASLVQSLGVSEKCRSCA